MLLYLPSYLDKLGTKEKSASEFKKQLFELGALMSFSSNSENVSLYVEGIDSKLEETVKLVNEFLSNFQHDDKAIKIIADEIKSNRKLDNKDLNNLLSSLELFAIYGEESPKLKEFSSKEIQKLKSKDFENSFRKMLNYEMTISYVGTHPVSKITEILEKTF
jgi:predicted Zn-dependent peptidase